MVKLWQSLNKWWNYGTVWTNGRYGTAWTSDVAMAQPEQWLSYGKASTNGGTMAQSEQMGDMAQPKQMTELLIVQFPHISW
jgi:hypothetical protein